MNLKIKALIALIVFGLVSCSSEDEVEFIDNSDALNKEFGVTNQIDESWLESLNSSSVALTFTLVEHIEYSNENGKWEVVTGDCPSRTPLRSIKHWTPKNIIFKDGNIFISDDASLEVEQPNAILNLCCIAYKNDSGLTPVYYKIALLEFDPSVPVIKGAPNYLGRYEIVELSQNTLIIKEEHEKCYSLTKYQFSPYFEFEDGIFDSDIRFISLSKSFKECYTKFFKEFKTHFGDKVNLAKLANNGNPVVFDREVYNGDIDMNILENFLRKNNFIE